MQSTIPNGKNNIQDKSLLTEAPNTPAGGLSTKISKPSSLKAKFIELRERYQSLASKYDVDLMRKDASIRNQFLDEATPLIKALGEFTKSYNKICPDPDAAIENVAAECIIVERLKDGTYTRVENYLEEVVMPMRSLSFDESAKPLTAEQRRQLKEITNDARSKTREQIQQKINKLPWYKEMAFHVGKFLMWFKPTPKEAQKWNELFLAAETTFESTVVAGAELTSTRWGLFRVGIVALGILGLRGDMAALRSMRRFSRTMAPRMAEAGLAGIRSSKAKIGEIFVKAYVDQHGSKPAREVTEEFLETVFRKFVQKGERLTEKSASKILAKEASKRGVAVSFRVWTKALPYIGWIVEIGFLVWDYCHAFDGWGDCWASTKEGVQMAGHDYFKMEKKTQEYWAAQELNIDRKSYPNKQWAHWPDKMQCVWCAKNDMKKPTTRTFSGEEIESPGPDCYELMKNQCSALANAEESGEAQKSRTPVDTAAQDLESMHLIADKLRYTKVNINRSSVKEAKELGSFPYLPAFPKVARYGIQRNLTTNDVVTIDITDHYGYNDAAVKNRWAIERELHRIFHGLGVSYAGGIVGHFYTKGRGKNYIEEYESYFDKLLRSRRGFQVVFLLDGANDDIIEKETDFDGVMALIESTFKKLQKKYTVFGALKNVFSEKAYRKVFASTGQHGRDIGPSQIKLKIKEVKNMNKFEDDLLELVNKEIDESIEDELIIEETTSLILKEIDKVLLQEGGLWVEGLQGLGRWLRRYADEVGEATKGVSRAIRQPHIAKLQRVVKAHTTAMDQANSWSHVIEANTALKKSIDQLRAIARAEPDAAAKGALNKAIDGLELGRRNIADVVSNIQQGKMVATSASRALKNLAKVAKENNWKRLGAGRRSPRGRVPIGSARIADPVSEAGRRLGECPACAGHVGSGPNHILDDGTYIINATDDAIPDNVLAEMARHSGRLGSRVDDVMEVIVKQGELLVEQRQQLAKLADELVLAGQRGSGVADEAIKSLKGKINELKGSITKLEEGLAAQKAAITSGQLGPLRIEGAGEVIKELRKWSFLKKTILIYIPVGLVGTWLAGPYIFCSLIPNDARKFFQKSMGWCVDWKKKEQTRGSGGKKAGGAAAKPMTPKEVVERRNALVKELCQKTGKAANCFDGKGLKDVAEMQKLILGYAIRGGFAVMEKGAAIITKAGNPNTKWVGRKFVDNKCGPATRRSIKFVQTELKTKPDGKFKCTDLAELRLRKEIEGRKTGAAATAAAQPGAAAAAAVAATPISKGTDILKSLQKPSAIATECLNANTKPKIQMKINFSSAQIHDIRKEQSGYFTLLMSKEKALLELINTRIKEELRKNGFDWKHAANPKAALDREHAETGRRLDRQDQWDPQGFPAFYAQGGNNPRHPLMRLFLYNGGIITSEMRDARISVFKPKDDEPIDMGKDLKFVKDQIGSPVIPRSGLEIKLGSFYDDPDTFFTKDDEEKLADEINSILNSYATINASLTTGMTSLRKDRPVQSGGGEGVLYLYRIEYSFINPLTGKVFAPPTKMIITRLPGGDFGGGQYNQQGKITPRTTDRMLIRDMFNSINGGLEHRTLGIFGAGGQRIFTPFLDTLNAGRENLYTQRDFDKENIYIHDDSRGFHLRGSAAWMGDSEVQAEQHFSFREIKSCSAIPKNVVTRGEEETQA
jgi:hypothetical protein